MNTRPPIIQCSYTDLASTLRRIEEQGGICIRMDVQPGTYRLTLNWPQPKQLELLLPDTAGLTQTL